MWSLVAPACVVVVVVEEALTPARLRSALRVSGSAPSSRVLRMRFGPFLSLPFGLAFCIQANTILGLFRPNSSLICRS